MKTGQNLIACQMIFHIETPNLAESALIVLPTSLNNHNPSNMFRSITMKKYVCQRHPDLKNIDFHGFHENAASVSNNTDS